MPASVAEPAAIDRQSGETGPGASGYLRLVVARIAGRTRIVDLECSGPIQVLRCQYLDDRAPDIASVMIASPSGGVLQGDRLRMSVEVRPGARLVLETQSATRLYRMPLGGAHIETRLQVQRDGWLQYVPDPYIPFTGSDTTIETVVDADPTAAIVIGEEIAAGRVANGEVFAMRRFESSLTVVDPAHGIRFTDATILEPGEALANPGMLGGNLAIGSLYLIARGADAASFRTAIGAVGSGRAFAGASTLPNDAGAWLRVLGADIATARAVVAAGVDAARASILGAAGPSSRRP